jgi:hypothetical protein
MKKIGIIVAIVVIAGGVFYFSAFKQPKTPANSKTNIETASASSATPGGAPGPMVDSADSVAINAGGGDDQGADVVFDKPATELYKDFDAALAALKKGAADYDDITLEQFTNLPENCSWCGELYAAAKDMMINPSTPSEQRSFYAEVLAVSGRPENLKSLIEAAKGATSDEDRDLFTQALELSQGGDKIAPFLSDQLKDAANDGVKESIVAALTNQGSRVATELLYQYIDSKGGTDPFYQVGTGPAEVVPQPEVFPYLQERILKRDGLSGDAVKSLLNAGVDGLKLVMSSIANSPNRDADRKMLEGALDHMSFDEDSLNFLKNLRDSSPDPFVKETATKYLAAAEEEAAKAVPATDELADGASDGDDQPTPQ